MPRPERKKKMSKIIIRPQRNTNMKQISVAHTLVLRMLRYNQQNDPELRNFFFCTERISYVWYIYNMVGVEFIYISIRLYFIHTFIYLFIRLFSVFYFLFFFVLNTFQAPGILRCEYKLLLSTCYYVNITFRTHIKLSRCFPFTVIEIDN